mgnify:FL=1
MRIVTFDDFIDLYTKAKQRGIDFVLSKMTFRKSSRTKTAFNQQKIVHSNWWIVPMVRRRWNNLITGDDDLRYEDYLMTNILQDEKKLRLLSIGSGVCSHELELAKYDNFEELICLDIAENRLNEAKALAHTRGIKNIQFICADFADCTFDTGSFDIVFFHQSLHHFDQIESLITQRISPWLKDNGKIIINEFVGSDRLQFSKKQIKAINEALKSIPKQYRVRFRTRLIKSSFHGSGVLRMIFADPSECIDSSSILPCLHNNFVPLIEKSYGGNILMNVLKDISHHFVVTDAEKEKILTRLFHFEDEYLKSNKSDFVFGVYQKKIQE